MQSLTADVHIKGGKMTGIAGHPQSMLCWAWTRNSISAWQPRRSCGLTADFRELYTSRANTQNHDTLDYFDLMQQLHNFHTWQGLLAVDKYTLAFDLRRMY